MRHLTKTARTLFVSQQKLFIACRSLLNSSLRRDLHATAARLVPFCRGLDLYCHPSVGLKNRILSTSGRLELAGLRSSQTSTSTGVMGDTAVRVTTALRSTDRAQCGKADSSSSNGLSVLVLHRDQVLLGRRREYPEHAFALLQGALQQGEQEEEAVARVAGQQAGIAIDQGSIQRLRGLAAFTIFCCHTVTTSSPDSPSGLDLLKGKARECANEVRLEGHEVDAVLGNPPPQLQLDEATLDDAKWFCKRWLIAHNTGQVPSTNFRLYSGKDGKAGEAMTMWLDQTHSDFPLDQIPDVTIETGIFKYVLLVVTDEREGQSKLLVRGDRQSGYHMDIFEKTVKELLPYQLHVAEPLGGGRIRHDDGSKAITIYGYSSAYGQAPHDLSAAIVKQWFPMYAPDKITVSYEGY